MSGKIRTTIQYQIVEYLMLSPADIRNFWLALLTSDWVAPRVAISFNMWSKKWFPSCIKGEFIFTTWLVLAWSLSYNYFNAPAIVSSELLRFEYCERVFFCRNWGIYMINDQWLFTMKILHTSLICFGKTRKCCH